MAYTIRIIKESDYKEVTDIFNYYVKNSMAAYPVEEAEIDYLLSGSIENSFIVLEVDEKVEGFAKLSWYHASSTFSKSAKIGYFISEQYTGKGYAKKLLRHSEEFAKNNGIENIFAHLSSENKPSQILHEKNGFKQCGIFPKIGKKFGKEFDIIWYVKNIK